MGGTPIAPPLDLATAHQRKKVKLRTRPAPARIWFARPMTRPSRPSQHSWVLRACCGLGRSACALPREPHTRARCAPGHPRALAPCIERRQATRAALPRPCTLEGRPGCALSRTTLTVDWPCSHVAQMGPAHQRATRQGDGAACEPPGQGRTLTEAKRRARTGHALQAALRPPRARARGSTALAPTHARATRAKAVRP